MKISRKPAQLTPRQLAFAVGYARHGIAMRAAIEAGYSEATARAQSGRLLEIVGIREFLGEITNAAKGETIATVESLRERLTSIVRGDDPKFDSKDCLRAIELLGKSIGLFADKAPEGASRAELLREIAERLPD